MKGKFLLRILPVFAAGFLVSASCNKGDKDEPYTLSYGSSVLYLKNQASDVIVYPTQSRAGRYTAFPEGVELDEISGAINVTKSETGLRYRITHTATNGDTTSVIVLLSGLTVPDKYYHLSQNDSIAFPVYNGNAVNPVPTNGSTFDEGNGANSGGCSVRTTNGQINLSQTVRNGVFGAVPTNDVRRDFEIRYRLNDESGNALNKLKIRLYYYNTMADVPADVLQIMDDRQTQGVFLQMNNSNPLTSSFTARGTASAAAIKPRPPCVVIIGQ